MDKYVWTKKAEELSAKHGIIRKEGERATYGYEPVGKFGIRLAWLENGYIRSVGEENAI